MRRTIGIEVTQGFVRAAAVERRRGGAVVRATYGVPLGGGRALDVALADVAAALVEGPAPRCAVAPPPTDAWLKLVTLPPLGAAERARMLELEAERYFPVRGEAVIADAPTEGPVAAVRADVAEALATRVEEVLGPVTALEPAPRAVVRAWATLDPALRDLHFAVVARSGSWWEVAIARGATLLGHARLRGPGPEAAAAALAAAVSGSATAPRVLLAGEAAGSLAAFHAALAAALPGVQPEARAEMPGGVPADFAAAVGLALAPEGTLLPEAQRVRLQRTARRRTASWVAAAAAAGVLFVAADVFREVRGASATEQRIAAVQADAQAAAADLDRARRAIETVQFTDSLAAARPDWVAVLGELSARLPAGAYTTQFRGRADEGDVEIRGYAGRASSIVPLLERSERFHEVESLETVTRRTVGGVELENFALRFRVQP
jgi:Tfp pilus assembly protein PilN